MKPSELKRIVNKEFDINTLRAYQGVIEDRIYFVEKALDLGTRPQIKGFMSHMKNLKEALRQLEEEKPGLWANIRAKRARGEKPAHKNSKAHKDAVAAGKKINAMSEQAEWPQGTQSRYQEYSFKLIKVMPDRAKYSVTDMETGELKGTVVFNTVDQLHDYAADLIRPQGGRQSSHFGTK